MHVGHTQIVDFVQILVHDDSPTLLSVDKIGCHKEIPSTLLYNSVLLVLVRPLTRPCKTNSTKAIRALVVIIHKSKHFYKDMEETYKKANFCIMEVKPPPSTIKRAFRVLRPL